MALKLKKVMTQPINLMFRFLRQKVQIWIKDRVELRFIGIFQGFDEYMNIVLDECEEINSKKHMTKSLGKILLKGDNICLMAKYLEWLTPEDLLFEEVPNADPRLIEPRTEVIDAVVKTFESNDAAAALAASRTSSWKLVVASQTFGSGKSYFFSQLLKNALSESKYAKVVARNCRATSVPPDVLVRNFVARCLDQPVTSSASPDIEEILTGASRTVFVFDELDAWLEADNITWGFASSEKDVILKRMKALWHEFAEILRQQHQVVIISKNPAVYSLLFNSSVRTRLESKVTPSGATLVLCPPFTVEFVRDYLRKAEFDRWCTEAVLSCLAERLVAWTAGSPNLVRIVVDGLSRSLLSAGARRLGIQLLDDLLEAAAAWVTNLSKIRHVHPVVICIASLNLPVRLEAATPFDRDQTWFEYLSLCAISFDRPLLRNESYVTLPVNTAATTQIRLGQYHVMRNMKSNDPLMAAIFLREPPLCTRPDAETEVVVYHRVALALASHSPAAKTEWLKKTFADGSFPSPCADFHKAYLLPKVTSAGSDAHVVLETVNERATITPARYAELLKLLPIGAIALHRAMSASSDAVIKAAVDLVIGLCIKSGESGADNGSLYFNATACRQLLIIAAATLPQTLLQRQVDDVTCWRTGADSVVYGTGSTLGALKLLGHQQVVVLGPEDFTNMFGRGNRERLSQFNMSRENITPLTEVLMSLNF